ncbi:MAG: amidohydrolase family protein [Desulfobacterales bacterium]|nr:amidohydrolase family protein [Desulfobacterales bacterium]
MRVIDSHIHCGVQNVSQPISRITPLLDAAGIREACLFAPVEDIYYRYTSDFDDNEEWRSHRRKAHEYLLALASEQEGIFPYYFVWNDFLVEDLEKGFRGIKWHHHAGEPPYRYEDPRCARMIDAICARGLPIVFEETLQTTLMFLERVAGRTPVIIPHLGLLNGGYDALAAAGVWEEKNIFADTALAGNREITDYLERRGAHRLIFGSDWPFGDPGAQLMGLKSLGAPRDDLEKICAGNILGLLGKSE